MQSIDPLIPINIIAGSVLGLNELILLILIFMWNGKVSRIVDKILNNMK